MKLASLNDGKRDGELAVVSRDLKTAHIANGAAPTLQAALDAFSAANWTPIPPQTDHRFHGKPATQSSANWTAIPLQTKQFEAA